MQTQDVVQMRTARLFLRTLTEADADIVKNLWSDEFKTTEAALEHIRWINNRAYENRLVFNLYIWVTQLNVCIGRVYIHAKPELNGEVEIGYGISEAYRNNGYTTEAAKALVQYAFEKAGQDALAAIVKPENIASRRVLEKLGFVYRNNRMVTDDDGVDREFRYYQLPRSDWQLGSSSAPNRPTH